MGEAERREAGGEEGSQWGCVLRWASGLDPGGSGDGHALGNAVPAGTPRKTLGGRQAQRPGNQLLAAKPPAVSKQLRAWELWHSSFAARHQAHSVWPSAEQPGKLAWTQGLPTQRPGGRSSLQGRPEVPEGRLVPVLAQPGPACLGSAEGVNTKARPVPGHAKRTQRPGNLWVHRAGCWAGAGATKSARPCVRGREEQKQKEDGLGRQREEEEERHIWDTMAKTSSWRAAEREGRSFLLHQQQHSI